MKRSRVSVPPFVVVTVLILAVAIIAEVIYVAVVSYSSAPASSQTSNEAQFYEHLITDEAAVSELDVEFSSFIGEGHYISEYCYSSHLPEERFSASGFGPISAYFGHEVIVGKAGSIGIIAYFEYDNDRDIWLFYEQPQADSITTVLVLEGCVAPEPWWDHPLLHGTFLDNSSGNTVHTVTPWNDNEDFDNPTKYCASQKYPWYWNGRGYVEMTPDVANIKGFPYDTNQQSV